MLMETTSNRIKNISKILNVPENEVLLVMYTYLCETIKEMLILGKAKSIFGELYLNENGELQITKIKSVLEDLLNKEDLTTIRTIVKHGPGTKIFQL